MISVRDVDELRAIVIAMSRLRRDVRNDINRATRATLAPAWQGEVKERATGPMDRRVLDAGTRLKPGNPPVLQAAQSRRGIGKSKRLKPSTEWYAWEFGADREKYETYTRKGHKVTRRAQRQLPTRYRKGRVIYPAAANIIPRAAALWVQLVVRKVHEAAEGRTWP